jgi:hypothetical protein
MIKTKKMIANYKLYRHYRKEGLVSSIFSLSQLRYRLFTSKKQKMYDMEACPVFSGYEEDDEWCNDCAVYSTDRFTRCKEEFYKNNRK